MIKDVEKRLAEYRASKLTKPKPQIKVNRKEPEQNSSEQNLSEKSAPKVKKESKKEPKTKETSIPTPVSKETLEQTPIATSDTTSFSVFGKYKREIDISINLLKFVLWLLLMTVFVEVEFGAVFLICSIFYIIFRNFRSGPKKEGEPSAYSVFNPNCEAIDGTLTAEQFERELLRGPKSLQ